tara:strand:- start:86 stop:388 length:303 start_codon:yes stop_codon:yes gene_type:complete
MTAEQMIAVTEIIGTENVLDIDDRYDMYLIVEVDLGNQHKILILPDGTEYWYYKNKMHREGGPACRFKPEHDPILTAGDHWYLNGEKMTEEEHAAATQER